MRRALAGHWPEYGMEAALLAIFMLAACLFGALLGHPGSPLRATVAGPFVRRALMRNLVLRNQVVFGTVNAPREAFQAAIRDLTTFEQRWPAALRALITARVPLAAAPAQLAEGGGRDTIKNVVAIS